MMRYGSVCSGIEAATVAWEPLGWKPAFFSEIDAFPRAVLTHHYPTVPLHGDFTTISEGQYDPIDLLVGGTPCQDFSVAGLRKGLDGDRGNLTLEFLRLADRLRPKWVVWENVPGILSIDGGRTFGTFLGGLGELGYGFAYRVLDAQYFGVPQRRRRVFVVGYLGDWRRAAAVLFERHSLQGHSAPRRSARQTVAALTANGVGTCGADDNQGQAGHLIAFGGNNTSGPIDVATALNACSSASGRMDFESETFVATTLRSRDMSRGVDSDCTDILIAHTLRAEGFDASEDGTGRGTPLVPIAFDCKASAGFAAAPGEIAPTLRAMASAKNHNNAGGQLAVVVPIQEAGKRTGTSTDDPRAGIGIGSNGDPMFTLQACAQHAVGITIRGREGGATAEVGGDISNALRASQGGGDKPYVMTSAVRRLLPTECEALQGFPRNYTLIPYGKKLAAEAKEELARYFERTGQYMREVSPQRWVFDRERFEREWPKIASDGPRYKALGNSMAVPVMAWIGRRIQMVEDLLK